MDNLIAIGIRGGCLLGVVLLIRSVPGLRRIGRHGSLLAMAMGWLLIIPIAVAAGVRMDLGILPRQHSGEVTAAQRADLMRLGSIAPESRTPTEFPRTASDGVSQPLLPSPVEFRWPSKTALMVYLFVAIGIVIVRLIAVHRLNRIVRASKPAPRALIAAADSAARQLALTGRPRICESSEASLPFVTGIVDPTIVFPIDATSWGEARLRAVMLHELAHVERHDVLLRAVADTACALHWFNPFAWIAAARLRAEAEIACDEAVVLSGVPAITYAHELVQLARLYKGAHLMRHVTGIAGSTALHGRIEAILASRGARIGVANAALAVLLASATGFASAVGVPVQRVVFQQSGAALNVSNGGPEISSNDAGLQARWTEDGRVSAVFLTGNVDLSDVANGRLKGAGRLLLIEEAAAGLRVFEWRNGGGDEMPSGVRRSLTIGGQQLASLSGRHGRFPGSSLSGLPAVSDDPSENVVQAGWLSGNERYGLAFRGKWLRDGTSLKSDDPKAWLVLFAFDSRTKTVRRFQLARDGADRLQEALFIDGVQAPVDQATRAWSAAAFDEIRRLAPDYVTGAAL